MIGIVMAGGKSTRMNRCEKLLLGSRPVILNVIQALLDSKCFTNVIAVTSPHAPKTHQYLKQHNITIHKSLGNGYVQDLNSLLSNIDEHALVISGDMPLIDSDIICDIVDMYNPKYTWTSILITADYATEFGISLEAAVNIHNIKHYYTGISLVNSSEISDLTIHDENYIILDDKRISVNLNTPQDLDLFGIA